MKQSYKEIILTWFCICISAIILSFFLLIFTNLFMPPFNCELIEVNSTAPYIIYGYRGLI